MWSHTSTTAFFIALASVDMATASDLLAEVNAAISKCLLSQSYSMEGRQNQRARLQELQLLRRELLQEIQDEGNGGGMSSLGIIDPAE